MVIKIRSWYRYVFWWIIVIIRSEHNRKLFLKKSNFIILYMYELPRLAEGYITLRGTGPLCMVMIYILSDATWHKKQEHVWFRGGDLNGFWGIRTLPV
jgi:hypothetical protein